MALTTQIAALATRVANHIRDAVVPRLLPLGGTAGQVLAKVDATNYNVGWAPHQKITVGATAPPSPALNDLWVDTN